jgi:hypothetical protein
MSDIQRWEPTSEWEIDKYDLGDYVQYEDHAAIVAQLESQLAEANFRLAKYSNMCARLTCETYDHGTSERKAFNEATIACARLIDASIASIQDQGK